MKITVFSDVHGNLPALEIMLKRESDTDRFIFLGDAVNYAPWSNECVQLITSLNNIVLLRGNHESRQISLSYGFYEEIMRKYGNTNPWRYFTDVFDYFSIAAIIAAKLP